MTAVNFITAHDGFTMYDLVTYAEKRNGCTLNPVCCDSPASSWWWNKTAATATTGAENGARTMRSSSASSRRNFFAAMMFSHGTPMMLGGDEWMRTQLGNNNAYSTGADNAYNWFRWGLWQADDYRHRMHDFVRQMTRWRLSMTHAVAPGRPMGGGAPFAWKSPSNTEDVNWSAR